MMGQKYKVLVGVHYERVSDFSGSRHDPNRHKLYKAGDIVESDRELDVQYVNKFEKLVGQYSASPERVLMVSRMIEAGPWRDDDRSFLEGLLPEDFARLAGRIAQAFHGNNNLNANDKPASAKSVLGEDCTSEFQRAYDEGFKVWRDAKGRLQVTRGSDARKPLNPHALKAEEVDKFVDQYLKEKR